MTCGPVHFWQESLTVCCGSFAWILCVFLRSVEVWLWSLYCSAWNHAFGKCYRDIPLLISHLSKPHHMRAVPPIQSKTFISLCHSHPHGRMFETFRIWEKHQYVVHNSVNHHCVATKDDMYSVDSWIPLCNALHDYTTHSVGAVVRVGGRRGVTCWAFNVVT